MKQMSIDVGANGIPTYAVPIPDNSMYSGDTGTSALNITVPSGAKIAMISCDGDFWLKEGSTAVVPTTWGTGSGHEAELIRGSCVRKVTAGDTISVITAATQKMSISWYS